MRRPPFTPGGFLVVISVRCWVDFRAIVRLEGLPQMENTMTSSGIEPATFRLVALLAFQKCTSSRGVFKYKGQPIFASLVACYMYIYGQHHLWKRSVFIVYPIGPKDEFCNRIRLICYRQDIKLKFRCDCKCPLAGCPKCQNRAGVSHPFSFTSRTLNTLGPSVQS
jgi:hypothetical protein